MKTQFLLFVSGLLLVLMISPCCGEDKDAAADGNEISEPDKTADENQAGDPGKKDPKDPEAGEKPDAVPSSSVRYLDAKKTIKVDLKEKYLQIPAKSNLVKSLIELALCSVSAPSHRSHESSFVTKCKPSLIHAGLMLIGLKPGKPVKFSGEDRVPKGAPVYIYVTWKDKDTGRDVTYRMEELIFNYYSEEPLFCFKWIFTGSNMINVKGKRSYYEADEEGTIIATWHVPAAVIDIPLPEGSDDTAFYSYEKRMPPAGTEVHIIFSSKEMAPKKKTDAEADVGADEDRKDAGVTTEKDVDPGKDRKDADAEEQKEAPKLKGAEESGVLKEHANKDLEEKKEKGDK